MRSFVHERSGLRLAGQEIGNGPAMVFQHGLCGDASQTAEVFPPDIGWRCVTLECRGHGQSEAGSPESYSIAAFADDIASMIETRESGPVVLGGISMGAAIALRVAVLRPELVRGLVLARPAWIDAAGPANLAPMALAGSLLRGLAAEVALARFEASDVARELAAESPDNLASVRGMFARVPIATTAELLCRIAAGGTGLTRQQIRRIEAPTIVVGAKRDFVHPLGMALELAGLIGGAEFVEITSKSESRERYVAGFREAMAGFLGRR